MKRIYVDTEVAEKVVRMFEFAADGVSLDRIRLRVHAMRLRARKGKIMGRSSVHAMLTNPFYMGKLRYGGKLIQGVHEPIVSKELFEQVQQQLAGKRKCREIKYSTDIGLEPAEPEDAT
jgi:site-specific DNA recombinase